MSLYQTLEAAPSNATRLEIACNVKAEIDSAGIEALWYASELAQCARVIKANGALTFYADGRTRAPVDILSA